MEGDIVTREGIPYQTIPAAGIHGVGARALPGNMISLSKGFFASRRILKEFNPHVMLFTGGYLAVPMALAGIRLQSLLYVPDIEPGLALKTIAHYSDHIALTAEDSKPFFKNKPCTVTGYPTRPELKKWDKLHSKEYFQITSSKPVLLVFGGSKGAHSINLAVTGQITRFLELAEVIHISGTGDWEMLQSVKSTLPVELQARYHIQPYVHEMGAALSAADLSISRSGASILGEYPLFSLPSILVPYPYAWRYQKVNADYLANHRAAVIVENEALEKDLLHTAASLLNAPTRLEEMSQAAARLARPDAAENIANILEQLASSNPYQGRKHG